MGTDNKMKRFFGYMPGELRAKSFLKNWGGDQLCAIDVETTGLDPRIHEIIQIAILPLNGDCTPANDCLPFYILIQPENLDSINEAALRVNKLSKAKLMRKGMKKDKAIDLLVYWFERLGIKRIIPLGHNYNFDRQFILNWLGHELYDTMFNAICRDTLIIAAYICDCRNLHGKKTPKHLRLIDLCLEYGIEPFKAHDALYDCQLTAQLYKRMVLHAMLPVDIASNEGPPEYV